MAFDVNTLDGRVIPGANFSNGYQTGPNVSDPANSIINPDGSFTINVAQESVEDAGVAITYLITAYNATLAPDVIEWTEVDNGVVNTALGYTRGAVAVASDSKGTIFEIIEGFAPIGRDQGKYVGGFTDAPKITNPIYFLITNTINLDKFDPVSGDPIPSGLAVPATFASLMCFGPGTRIATPGGARAVETLGPGDLVLTASGAARPVVWRGVRTVDCARHPKPDAVRPVRIAAHAFGDAPTRPLTLSPDHAVHVDGVLIPVKHLVDGRAIARVATDRITYYHIELDSHDVLLAEGLPAESYLDTGGRAAFAGEAVTQLHPGFAAGLREAEACAPFVVAGPVLEAVRARLAELADARDAA